MVMPTIAIVMRMGMGMDVGMFMDPEFRCGHTCLQDAIDRHVPAFNREAAQRGLELVERQARIEERTKNHVARRAGEAIEVENPHTRPSCLKLKNAAPPRMM